MERGIEVHIDWQGATRPVGRLWARAKGARQTCTFAYDAAWLGLAGAFALDPNLPLVRGDAHLVGHVSAQGDVQRSVARRAVVQNLEVLDP